MKLIITMVVEQEIKDMEELKAYYEADTLEEAVANQQMWIDEGACDLHDLIEGAVKTTVTSSGEE